MKISLEATTKIVELNGVPARIWEGETERGVPVHAYITRLAVNAEAAPREIAVFERELESCRAPSAEVRFIPDRLTL